MNILRLSYQNLKRNFSSYIAFIFSLSFCTFILYNFLNLIDSGTLDILGKKNQEFSEIIIFTVTFVLVFFVFCFIWYASNVFLTQRKKEMGTFIFMGLDNRQLGKMYFLEMMMVGILSIIIGILSGIAFSKLFGMLFFKLSEVDGVIGFSFQLITLFKTAGIFLIIYAILMIKGYWNILRTSVKDMLNATKQSEFKRTHGLWTFLKAVISVIIICLGYYSALQIGDITSFGYMFLATLCMIVGIYGLYNSLMPYMLTKLSDHKKFLYRKERNLWINHLIFRVKKNYRTYAIVTIMMLCCVSALGAGLAMKQRYDAMTSAEAQFDYSFLGREGQEEKINAVIETKSAISQSADIPFIPYEYKDPKYTTLQMVMIVSYPDYLNYCKKAKLESVIDEPQSWQGVELSRRVLISMAGSDKGSVPIKDHAIEIIQSSDESYFGTMQYNANFLVVNQSTYEQVKKQQIEMNLYVANIENKKMKKELATELKTTLSDQLQVIVSNPEGSEIAFIRVIYSVCIFMFAVFAISCGGVIFMKIYHDAGDDRQRYQILMKMGISRRNIHHAIQRELAFVYVFPIIMTAFSSYFIMTALQNLMQGESLMNLAFVSIFILFLYYLILYVFSLISFEKRTGIRR